MRRSLLPSLILAATAAVAEPAKVEPAPSKDKMTTNAAVHSDEELRKRLTPLQYSVTRENATERPFVNEFWKHAEEGLYVDIISGKPLFSSRDKFDTECGWPAFSKPIQDSEVKELRDRTHGMERTEVRSKTGDAHLGHVFTEGPKERGGLRYCINSASLRFIPKSKLAEAGYGDYVKNFEGPAPVSSNKK